MMFAVCDFGAANRRIVGSDSSQSFHTPTKGHITSQGKRNMLFGQTKLCDRHKLLLAHIELSLH